MRRSKEYFTPWHVVRTRNPFFPFTRWGAYPSNTPEITLMTVDLELYELLEATASHTVCFFPLSHQLLSLQKWNYTRNLYENDIRGSRDISVLSCNHAILVVHVASVHVSACWEKSRVCGRPILAWFHRTALKRLIWT